jgi:hypothetical protein
MKFSKAPGWPFFTSWYVIVNTLIIVSYPFLRIFTSVGSRNLRHLDSFGFTYENSIIYSGLAFIGVYYLRSTSLRSFLLDCLSIGKIIVISLLFFAKIHLCLYYSIVCFVTWLIIPYPRYNAPNKFIKIESAQQFDELVGEVSLQKPQQDHVESQQSFHYRDKKMFFIEFYADWMYPCNSVLINPSRARNYGMSTPTGTPPRSSNSCRSTSPACPNWPRSSTSTSPGSPSSCPPC